MSHPTDDTQLLASILQQEAERHADPGEHAEPEELLAYIEGTLGEERTEALRNHLVACPRCAAAVVDLGDLATPPGRAAEAEDTGRNDTADFATAADWRRLQRHLGSLRREPAAASGLEARRGGPVTGRLSRWMQHAAVAVLCLGLGYLAALYSAPSTPAPQVDVPVVYLDTITRTGGEEMTVTAAPEGVFVLIIAPSDESPAEHYRVVIEGEADGGDGAVRWSTDGLTPTQLGTLRLALPRDLLPPGSYRLTVLGLGGESSEPRPAGRHRLRVLP